VTGRLLYPFFNKRLDPDATGEGIDRGKGTKQITLKGGRRLKFKARSPKSGQGLTGDVVVLDEAFAVEPEHTAALIPTLSTRRRAMVLYGSRPDMKILRFSAAFAIADARWRCPGVRRMVRPGSFDEPGCSDPSCMHLIGFPGCALDNNENIQAPIRWPDAVSPGTIWATSVSSCSLLKFAREAPPWLVG
jgi:hypothetical protein